MGRKAAAGSSRLTKYQAKRDFTRTTEPSGTPHSRPTGNLFVVQRHRARRRHYDLRLELDGVLLSWAVPKGPTLDPKARRLAVQVEDHPLEYAGFEGIIPAGEYGGGDVIVWDTGTWQPVGDPAEGLRDGNLHFDLDGEKLKGRFVLVRTGDRKSDSTQWMLLHKKDDFAHAGWDAEDYPHSVKSGRTNDEVKAAPSALWRGDMPANQAEVALPASANTHEKQWKPPTASEWKAFNELGAKGTWSIGEQSVSLTNLDKVLFPSHDTENPLTKRDIIRYYASVAPTMLPYLAGRPLNMNRYPSGINKAGFWNKEVPEHAPAWLHSWKYPRAKSGDVREYIVADSLPALVWLANLAAIELHAWTSRINDIEHPTWVLFDIDPGPATVFEEVLVLARLHRTAFEHLGLRACPKITGQSGIQIWLPITPQYTYAQTRAWAKAVSTAIGKTVPDLISWAWRKDERAGRARLDYTQNVINKTLVAPYSLRPRPEATVSVPIEWAELDDPTLRPDRWTIRTIEKRLAATGDPFATLVNLEQKLPPL